MDTLLAEMPNPGKQAKAGGNGTPMAPIVIGVWNGAGGVGKTTVGTNLAFAIAQKGARTFFVNLDAPDDASLMMGLKAEPNISHWRADPRPETLASLVQKLDGLDVLAGFRDVFAQSEAIETPADQPGSVRALVAQAKQRYEVIVLDTPQSPIAAHVLAAADQLVLVARSGLADAHRTAVAYRTVVDRMAEGIPEACVHVVINRLQAGHRLDAARWRKAAATTLGRPFPPVVAQIEDDVRIGDAQDKRKLPVAEINTLRENLDPLIAALVPSLSQLGNGKSIQIGPFEVVR
jgi:cellulose biosynthesis protein BcsQ